MSDSQEVSQEEEEQVQEPGSTEASEQAAAEQDSESEAEDSETEDYETENSESEKQVALDLDIEQLEAEQRSALVEALLFAHGEPLSPGRIRQITGLPESEVADILESICMKFEIEDSGFRLVKVSGKYQFRTVQKFAPFIRKLKSSGPKKLSPAALETLAIVAYRQPIVKSDVETIRGVDATPTLKTLLERRLIKIVGHRATVGQPALYGTTDLFLKIFGLGSLAELPTLRDLQELDIDPGEVSDQEELFQAANQSDEDQELETEAQDSQQSELEEQKTDEENAQDEQPLAQVENG